MTTDVQGVYAIKNIESGKVYVGSALNIARRWYRHRRALEVGKHHSPKLQNSWLKHGPKAFVLQVVEKTADANRLVEREQHWMNFFDATTFGYNMCPTAGNCLGRVLSDETKAKLSACRKGIPRGTYSDEHRAAISASLRGVSHSLEHKAANSAVHKGVPWSPKRRAAYDAKWAKGGKK